MTQDRAALFEGFRESLVAETVAFNTLVGCLRAEQDQIVARTPEGLESAVREKMAAFEQAVLARDERVSCMKRIGLPLDPVAAELRLSANAELSECWKAMRRESREAALLNTLNSRLVLQRMQHVTVRLDALRAASGREPIYDATGKSGTTGTSRVIAAA